MYYSMALPILLGIPHMMAIINFIILYIGEKGRHIQIHEMKFYSLNIAV